jgi:hypothetical protein
MRQQISAATWQQIQTAYASGIGLREIARNMGVSQNTVLARARREKWTEQIVVAKQHVKPVHSNAITPMHSAAITMQERAERHVTRMAGITDKVLPHLESMEPAEILDSARNLERFDYVARRNFRLENQTGDSGPLTLAVLANHTAIQIIKTTD